MTIMKCMSSMASFLAMVVIYCSLHTSWSYLSVNINQHLSHYPTTRFSPFARRYNNLENLMRKKVQDSMYTLRATIQSAGFSNGIMPNNPILRKIQTDIQTVQNAHSEMANALISSTSIAAATAVAAAIGVALPWSHSIVTDKDLTYMKMFETQLQLVQQMGMTPIPLPPKFQYKVSNIKPARIGNMCFQNDIFRKVRMTYFDGGDNVQVFNSVWYPQYSYDLPMLGIDLISLGKSRVLTVIDFQPLQPTVEYAEKYISPLSEIRNKYPELQGVMSGKIYDDTSFFSKQMLFGRFTNESRIDSVVTPAFNEYLEKYLTMAAAAVPNHDERAKMIVKERQQAYDIYSAIKDPAVGLFDAYFGKEWSRDFVHEYLFSLSSSHNNGASVGSANVGSDQPVHTFSINQETGEVSVSSNISK